MRPEFTHRIIDPARTESEILRYFAVNTVQGANCAHGKDERNISFSYVQVWQVHDRKMTVKILEIPL